MGKKKAKKAELAKLEAKLKSRGKLKSKDRAKLAALVKARDKAALKKQMPKSECCVSKTRCKRCPIRMLQEGTLPAGYTVRKRKLVTVEKAEKLTRKKLAKAA